MVRYTRGIYPIIAAVVAVAILAFAFVSGLAAALNGAGTGTFGWVLLFFLMAVVLLAVLLVSIRNFVRAESRVLSVIAIVVTLLPVLTIAIFAVLSQGPLPS